MNVKQRFVLIYLLSILAGMIALGVLGLLIDGTWQAASLNAIGAALGLSLGQLPVLIMVLKTPRQRSGAGA